MHQENLGIITEYNPFHNGHLYNIEEGKKKANAQNVIVVMSGNYVQRGLPAIVDKYTRCEMALKAGADLCIEMPTHFALEGAENFSKCGISLLNHSNIVDKIVFGSESGDISSLKKVAKILLQEPLEYKCHLNSFLKEGYAYPKAIDLSLAKLGYENIFTANNTLGIQYIKSLMEFQSTIEPFTIKREGSSYHDTSVKNNHLGASASAIRELVYNNNDIDFINNYIPSNISNIFLTSIKNNYTNINNLSSSFHYILNTTPISELKKINHISEGIENRILESANKNFLISDIVNDCVTKRYTRSKIQRCIMSIILNIKKDDMIQYKNNNLAQYIRVLGYNKNKEFLLKDLMKKSTLPVIVSVNKSFLPPLAKKMLEEEKQFSNIYNLSYNLPITSKYSEVQSKPIIIKR